MIERERNSEQGRGTAEKTEMRKIRCANCGSEWELYPNFEEDQELDELCLIRCPLCCEAL